MAEVCSGSSTTCPSDQFEPPTTVCRGSGGECDLVEYCTGNGAACPNDDKKAPGTACTADSDPCSLDQCDGSSNACQHPAGNGGTICRPSAGDCDVAETCSGTSTGCPANVFAASSTVCRSAAGTCDAPESCTGSGPDCPADLFQPGNTPCRAAAGVCDLAEVCSGNSADCPANIKSTALCRAAAGVCDKAEFCNGSDDDCPADALEPNTTECRAAANDCDLAESCDGVNAACPADSLKGAGASCGSSLDSECTKPDTCDGSGTCLANDEPAATACGDPSDTECDNPDSCDGSGTCLPRHEPSTRGCADDGIVCTADRCDGAGACQHPAGNGGTVCRPDAGACDVAEVCNGTDTTCPPDAFEPAGAACGSPTATDCSRPDTCDGSGTCLANDEPVGADCNDGDACTSGDQCDGSGACTSGPPTVCAPCEFCNATGGCTPASQLTCEAGAIDKSSLVIVNNGDDTKDRLVFKWRGAGTIQKADFGSPTSTTNYELCIFDDKASPGLPDTLVYALSVPAAGTCAGRDCWKDLVAGFLYRDNDLTPDGVQRVLLRSGAAGKSRILVKAKGTALGLSPNSGTDFFSQSPNVTVVMAANNAPKCFKAVFPGPSLRNLTTRYKDKN